MKQNAEDGKNGQVRSLLGRAGAAAHRAFTLIELLVVIAVIALLMSLILPSLGGARRTTWTVICQSNLSQLGKALQMYFDNQKDPVFPDLQDPTNPNALLYVKMVDVLNDFVGGAGSKAFNCPAAKGLSSVRDPANIIYLHRDGGRIYSLPPQSNPTTLDIDYTGARAANIEKYTEYWFNDFPAIQLRGGRTKGVAGQRLRLIRRLNWVCFATDALDEFPRHAAKGNKGNEQTGKNNLLMGDLSIRTLAFEDYYNAYDPLGAGPRFWDWGHNYPPDVP